MVNTKKKNKERVRLYLYFTSWS